MTAKNKLSNKAQHWSGRAKETIGEVTGGRRTQYEGKLDQVKANLKDHRERVQDAFRRFIRLGAGRTRWGFKIIGVG